MELPQMVLFDYGQTLIAEQKFDGVKGTEAVLQYAARNKYHLSAEQVQAKANEINREFGRFDPEKRHLFQIEIPNTMFTPYLYESQGIEIALSNSEIDTIFWNAAAPGTPTEGIEDFLEYLKNKGIRTGVISNISYDPSVVAARINRLLPENAFEFIITSSNFIFRKPNKRIFDLALEKAELQPYEVWYIGDQYECDVKGSLNAGLLPIWYIGAIDSPYTEDKDILTVMNILAQGNQDSGILETDVPEDGNPLTGLITTYQELWYCQAHSRLRCVSRLYNATIFDTILQANQ